MKLIVSSLVNSVKKPMNNPMKSPWIGSFLRRLGYVCKSFRQPAVTVLYPDVVRALPLFARGKLRLDQSKCTGCLECQIKCPVGAIVVTRSETAPLPTTDFVFEPTIEQSYQVEALKVDYSRCVACGICVNVCSPAALQNDNSLLMGSKRVFDLHKNLVRIKNLNSGWKV